MFIITTSLSSSFLLIIFRSRARHWYFFSQALSMSWCRNGRLPTGKAFSLSHLSSRVNMASEKISTLMNPPGIHRDVE